MKKIFTTAVISLFIGILQSQTQSGSVIYCIKSISFKPADNGKQKDLINDIIENAEKQKFKLEFTSKKSKFCFLKNINNEANASQDVIDRLASLRFTSDFDYYLDKNSGIEFLHKTNGLIIKRKQVKLAWKITNETKIIDNYTCYKAELIKTYIARDNKQKSITVTAWFAPSLSFPYGPKDYNGLPGLILELNEKDTTYLVTKIDLDVKEKEISFPKGKTITQEEYDQRVMLGN